MWKKEEYSLDSIGIEGQYRIEQIPSISLDVLPIYSEKSHILTSQKGKRATFTKESALGHGSYGNLYLTLRESDGEQKACLMKQPRLAEMNLIQEGILQHIAQQTAEQEGIGWCIPKVYDVFLRQQKVWFSMEYISGNSVLDWFSKTSSADRDFLFLLAQICLSLLCLETNLGLDHRDLKLDNLLIKPCIHKIKRSQEYFLPLHFL